MRHDDIVQALVDDVIVQFITSMVLVVQVIHGHYTHVQDDNIEVSAMWSVGALYYNRTQ